MLPGAMSSQALNHAPSEVSPSRTRSKNTRDFFDDVELAFWFIL